MRLGVSRQPKRTVLKFSLVGVLVIFLFANSGSKAEGRKESSTSVDTTSIQSTLTDLDSYVTLKPNAGKPFVYANSIVLMDKESGEILWSKNPDEPVAVASTTKMTTALVARKFLKLDDVVTVPKSAVLVQGSKINLLTNEKITVESLLKGLLVQSGNDTAFTLAEYYGSQHGGDYHLFVDQMNAFLAENNITNTKFFDPAGLDDEQGRATARSLGHIARLVLKDPVLSEIVKIPTTTISSTDGTITHELKNSNRLVLGDSGLYLPGVLGVKTGFTPTAGHCLVSAYHTNSGDVVGVVLNTNDYTITASSSEMRKLFLWADANLIRQQY